MSVLGSRCEIRKIYLASPLYFKMPPSSYTESRKFAETSKLFDRPSVCIRVGPASEPLTLYEFLKIEINLTIK